jgi:hypothetical protein
MRNDAQDKIVELLTNSSPLLSEAAELLTITSAPVLGLPTTGLQVEDDPKGKQVPMAKLENLAIRQEGLTLASAVSEQVPVVSQAAPDVAAAAPNFAVAAYAA